MSQSSLEILSVPVEEELIFTYEGISEKVTFCISDLMGNIQLSGNVNCCDPNEVKIESLSDGIYLLTIVDGDHLVKARFRKD